MNRFRGPRTCQYCGRYEGTGATADTIIVLEKHNKQWRCQNHCPKTKKVVAPSDATQLMLEEEKGQPNAKPV